MHARTKLATVVSTALILLTVSSRQAALAHHRNNVVAVIPRGGGGVLKRIVSEKRSLLSAPWSEVTNNASMDPAIRWNVVGNIFNILSLVSVLYVGWNFARVDTATEYYGTPSFSKQFVDDGFCIKNRFSRWGSTHAACFYVDILLSAILMKLMAHYKKDIEDRNLHVDYLREMIPISTIVHGVGHLVISFLDNDEHPNPGKIAITVTTVVYFVVFYSLFAAASPTVGEGTTYSMQKRPKTVTYAINTVALLWAALAAWIWNQNDKFHRIQVGFTYVQTLSMTYAAIVQLFILPRESKTLAYAAWSAIVTFMVNVVAWLVAVDCQTKLPGIRQSILELGGHLWYDSFVSISYILFLYFGLKLVPVNIVVAERKWKWLRFWEKSDQRPLA